MFHVMKHKYYEMMGSFMWLQGLGWKVQDGLSCIFLRPQYCQLVDTVPSSAFSLYMEDYPSHPLGLSTCSLSPAGQPKLPYGMTAGFCESCF